MIEHITVVIRQSRTVLIFMERDLQSRDAFDMHSRSRGILLTCREATPKLGRQRCCTGQQGGDDES